MIDWAGYLQLMLAGALLTVELTVAGAVVAFIMAMAAGLGRMSRYSAVRAIATSYIEFFRGTSIFVQLFWIYFVLPLLGVSISSFAAGVMALGLNVGGYGAEVVRGAFKSVGREQHEAGIALNFTPWQRTRHIILPQAFVIMLPTFGNNAIELLKATSVVSLISLADLTFQAQVVRAQTGSTLVPFLAVLILYYAMALSISWAMRLLERRVTRGLDGVRT